MTVKSRASEMISPPAVMYQTMMRELGAILTAVGPSIGRVNCLDVVAGRYGEPT